MAAQRGARVAVAEDAALGGTCVNVGCIPKKLYSFAAHYAESFEEAHGFGWSVGEPRFDWATLKANRAREIARLNGVYGAAARARRRRHPARPRARWSAPHAVEVDGARLTAPSTSSSPPAAGRSPPTFPAREHAISSNEIFDLDALPGARWSSSAAATSRCEFASIFNGLGAQVTQLYRGEQILRGFDRDVRDFVAAEMRNTASTSASARR